METLIVTGAGHGIGAAIAGRAANEGVRVGVLDIDGDAAQAVASALPEAVPLVVDTSDETAVEAALDHFGGAPDGIVCNAGIVRFGPLLDLDLQDFRSVVDVNLTGTYVTARAVARRWVEHGRGGQIVAVTSMNGVAPGPNSGAYGATKAGIGLLVQQMAIEWGQRGIRVNAVAPGLIDGGMSSPIYADPEFRALRASKVPAGRLGTEEDIAAAVAWLLSDESSYVTGQTLLVDGGVTMNMIGQLPRPPSVDRVGKGEG